MRLFLIACLLTCGLSAQAIPGWETVGPGCGGGIGIPPTLAPNSVGWLGEQYTINSITNANCINIQGFQIIRLSQPFSEVCVCPLPLPFAPGCFTYFEPWITQVGYSGEILWGYWVPLDSSLDGMKIMWQAIHVRQECDGDDVWLSSRAIEQTYAINPDNPPPGPG